MKSLLKDLVHSVSSALADCGEGREAASAAAALRPFLGHPRLLQPEQQVPDAERYRQHILHVDERGLFSIVALVWRPGQSTSIHDHVSWCVAGTHQGREREVQYELIEEPEGTYLVPVGECTNPVGAVAALTPPGDIHTVYNPGPDLAISIHVYGADVRKLGSSIRRRYEQPVRQPAEASVAALVNAPEPIVLRRTPLVEWKPWDNGRATPPA